MGERRFFAAISVVVACWATSCGDPDSELFADGTFTQKHKPEIMRDCQEAAECAVLNDAPLDDDPVTECVDQSARNLQSDAELQQSWLGRFCRCSQFTACEFYNCITSKTTTYGATQSDKLTHDCQASIDCRIAMGSFTGEAQSALQSCVSINIATLDSLNPQQRSQYEGGFNMCATLSGCAFQDCFTPLRPAAQPPAACSQ